MMLALRSTLPFQLPYKRLQSSNDSPKSLSMKRLAILQLPVSLGLTLALDTKTFISL